MHRITAYAAPCTADTRVQLHVQAYTHVSNPDAYDLDANPGMLGVLSYTLENNTDALDILTFTLAD